jgi:hypothetical protein
MKERILYQMGKGLMLIIPKDIGDFWGPYLKDPNQNTIPLIHVSWKEVDIFFEDKIINDKVCKVLEEDLKDEEGRVYRKGWKSNGWNGEKYDFYRMVQ